MIPDPLHPAVVHFPVVLAVLVPLIALGVQLITFRRGAARAAWMGVVALAALLVGSSWLAIETGEREEDTVESVLASEAPLARHEDRAEQFLAVAVGVLALTLVGLASGRAGQVGRVVAVVATMALIPAGIRVGHSGGELVYRYGAARAYSEPSGAVRADHGELSREARGPRE